MDESGLGRRGTLRARLSFDLAGIAYSGDNAAREIAGPLFMDER